MPEYESSATNQLVIHERTYQFVCSCWNTVNLPGANWLTELMDGADMARCLCILTVRDARLRSHYAHMMGTRITVSTALLLPLIVARLRSFPSLVEVVDAKTCRVLF